MSFTASREDQNNLDAKPFVRQANAFIQSGHVQEAIKAFDQALAIEPQNVVALSGRGLAASLAGDHEGAIKTLKTAYDLAPKEVAILLNLANAHIPVGLDEEALGYFQKAYDIDDTNTEASYWIGFLNEKMGNFSKAVTFYERTIELDPHHKLAYLQLADVFYAQGQKYDAFSVLAKGEVALNGDPSITFSRGRLLAKSVPGWHLPMLHDKERNDVYEQAINQLVKPDDIVLDIGTGSGLLAMMAARAGAKHVYACEMNPVLAAMAREIVAVNNLDDKITIIEKNSAEMVIGEDMPEKADVLVMEIFDSAIVGEDVMQTMDHAWAVLLKDGARSIPGSANLYGCLTQCPDIKKLDQVDMINGFDLSAMNKLSRPFAHRDMQLNLAVSEECKRLSEPFFITNFDFEKPPEMEFASETPEVKIKDSGTADSVLLWFDLELAPGLTFSTQDYQLQNHWRPVSQALLNDVSCEVGDTKMLQTLYQGFFNFTVLG